MVHDVAVIGSGPAALVFAVAAAQRGLGVVVLGGEDSAWPANYGAWVSDFERAGLGAFLGPVWSDAEVLLSDTERRRLGRPYGRVAKRRLRGHLLQRCQELGVVIHWQRAARAEHTSSGSTLWSDSGLAVRCRLVVDASGHRPALVRRDGEPTAWQAAVGVFGLAGSHPWSDERMTFMDWRPLPGEDAFGDAAPTFLYVMPLGGDRVFVEETSLVRAPALPYALLRQRLKRRLDGLEVSVGAIDQTEMCLIPMDAPVPDLTQRVVGFGAAASMVHPATGYLLPRVLVKAPLLADAIAEGLSGSRPLDVVARSAWRTLWTDEDLARRELQVFGARLIGQLNATETRSFFRAFFALPDAHWQAYLSPDAPLPAVLRAMASVFYHADASLRWRLARSGTRLPAALLRAVAS